MAMTMVITVMAVARNAAGDRTIDGKDNGEGCE
jgi:hypothetical protein